MRKYNPIIIAVLLVGLILGLHTYQIKTNPCYNMLRLHVIANSDTKIDQATKLKVRDEVLKLMRSRFSNVHNNRQAIKTAEASLDDIEKAADRTLQEAGKDYTAKAYVGDYDFPTRIYGSRVFPSGEYTAVRVVLGRGEGRNWWCVLFPPLCLRDLNHAAGYGTVDVRLKSLDMFRKASAAHSHRTVSTRPQLAKKNR